MTTALRLARIVAIAVGFALAFTVSQRATLARYGETIPGITWGIAALSVFFLIGAIATERTQGAATNVQKDLLWGLAGGGLLIVVSRW